MNPLVPCLCMSSLDHPIDWLNSASLLYSNNSISRILIEFAIIQLTKADRLNISDVLYNIDTVLLSMVRVRTELHQKVLLPSTPYKGGGAVTHSFICIVLTLFRIESSVVLYKTCFG